MAEKGTGDYGAQSSPKSAPQQEAVGIIIKELLDEVRKQVQETRPPALGPEAQKARDKYNEIKEALKTPTVDTPLKDQRWNLPKLDEHSSTS